MKNNFAKRLKELRLNRKLTKTKLAKEIGVSINSIRIWENGVRLPKVSNIIALSDYFNCRLNYLAGRDDIIN